VPQRAESLRLSSRAAKFYLENSDGDSPVKCQQTKVVKKNSRKKRSVKYEAIEEKEVKEDPEDVLGMLRLVVDVTQPPVAPMTDRPPATSPSERSRSVSLSEDFHPAPRSFGQQLCLMSSRATSIPKFKERSSHFSASSVFGLSNLPAPIKENKYYLANRRPASIHGSSYLKPKDPVQTLVKYFDEMTTTRAPHTHPPTMQAAQV
jgi:hypothetical protein